MLLNWSGKSLLLWTQLLAGLCAPSAAMPLEVAATISPVHSLVAGVMGTTGTPVLLIPGGQSPHTFSIRPRAARAIARADLVFRISAAYEISLDGSLSAVSDHGRTVDLIDAPGVMRLPARRIHQDTDQTAHDGPSADGDLLRAIDPHVWLDPHNARAVAREIARRLAAADPQHRPAYFANMRALDARLLALETAIRGELSPVKARPFIVFHDGYQYFERRFGLRFAGAVTEMPGRLVGAAHIHNVRKEIASADVACVFAEPQFEPRLVRTLTEGLRVRTGVLDALGADLEPGAELYFAMMRGLSHAFAACLASP